MKNLGRKEVNKNMKRQYIKKPVIISAIQFEDTGKSLVELNNFVGELRVDYKNPSIPILKIKTLEGLMSGNIGDYVVRGIKGEFYIVRKDIFEETYEAVKP